MRELGINDIRTGNTQSDSTHSRSEVHRSIDRSGAGRERERALLDPSLVPFLPSFVNLLQPPTRSLTLIIASCLPHTPARAVCHAYRSVPKLHSFASMASKSLSSLSFTQEHEADVLKAVLVLVETPHSPTHTQTHKHLQAHPLIPWGDFDRSTRVVVISRWDSFIQQARC